VNSLTHQSSNYFKFIMSIPRLPHDHKHHRLHPPQRNSPEHQVFFSWNIALPTRRDLPPHQNSPPKFFASQKFNVFIWIESTKQTDLNKDEADLSLLWRANLIEGQTKYTHRNVYRQ
jgi:hypothetical protein